MSNENLQDLYDYVLSMDPEKKLQDFIVIEIIEDGDTNYITVTMTVQNYVSRMRIDKFDEFYDLIQKRYLEFFDDPENTKNKVSYERDGYVSAMERRTREDGKKAFVSVTTFLLNNRLSQEKIKEMREKLFYIHRTYGSMTFSSVRASKSYHKNLKDFYFPD